MNHTLVPLYPAVLAVTLIASAPAASAAEPEAGVRLPLFNGHNLDGWHVTGCQAAVEDDCLVILEGNGLVRTDHRYRDFVLELSWRARKAENWDSGIYFRCELPPEGRPWPRRYQANLKQGLEGNVGGLPQATSSGLVKPGQWNHFRLKVVGQHAALQINGSPAWETDGIEAPDGFLALQVEAPAGGQFEFKDIFVTELGAVSLFNGQDLTGWEGGGADAGKCWKVEDGLLVCTGEKGPWLRSRDEFDDFNLRLEYKLKPGGNSGVYLRVPRNGAHRDPGDGVEIQVLDDRADRYQKLKPYQYTGSVYAIAAPRERVGREPGQWNSLEIDCLGHGYRITHNGVVVVEAAADEFPALTERRLKGFLGLQNHSEQVWYRNIRLGPSLQRADAQ